MKTPAEKLAAKKRRERKPRNRKPVDDGPVICHAREKREALDLTIRDVCEAIGLSHAGYHAIEHGGNAEMLTALKISEFYGCKLDELWEAKKDG